MSRLERVLIFKNGICSAKVGFCVALVGRDNAASLLGPPGSYFRKGDLPGRCRRGRTDPA